MPLNRGSYDIKWVSNQARGEARLQFLRKDPKGWQVFHDELAAHSALGSSLTFQGFQMKRPTVYALEERLRQLQVPTLIMIGDEDEPCVESAAFMNRRIPHAGLSVFPQSGNVQTWGIETVCRI